MVRRPFEEIRPFGPFIELDDGTVVHVQDAESGGERRAFTVEESLQ